MRPESCCQHLWRRKLRQLAHPCWTGKTHPFHFWTSTRLRLTSPTRECLSRAGFKAAGASKDPTLKPLSAYLLRPIIIRVLVRLYHSSGFYDTENVIFLNALTPSCNAPQALSRVDRVVGGSQS